MDHELDVGDLSALEEADDWCSALDERSADGGSAESSAEGPDWRTHPRLPRETDAAWLLQTLSIKEAQLRQMEACLLLPPPDQQLLTSMSRRAQALVANARRREAVLALKLRGLNHELRLFRKRELRAAQINRALRNKLREVLDAHEPNRLRHEARTLRADLDAALAREEALRRQLADAAAKGAADTAALAHAAATQRKLADDLEYVRGVAVHAMNARAESALGDGSLLPRQAPSPPV